MKILFSHVLPNVATCFVIYGVYGLVPVQNQFIISWFVKYRYELGIMICLQTDGFIFSGMRYWWLILPAGLAVTFLGRFLSCW